MVDISVNVCLDRSSLCNCYIHVNGENFFYFVELHLIGFSLFKTTKFLRSLHSY